MAHNQTQVNFARALIIYQDKIFLNRQKNKRGNWYQLPGTRQNYRETLHDSLHRFFNEEVGVQIVIRELRFVREYVGVNHEFMSEDAELHQVDHIFICDIRAKMEDPQIWKLLDQKGFGWISMTLLDKVLFYPQKLIHLLHPDGSLSGDFYLGDMN